MWLSKPHQAVLNALTARPQSAESLAVATGLPVAAVQAALTTLWRLGRAAASGGRWRAVEGDE